MATNDPILVIDLNGNDVISNLFYRKQFAVSTHDDKKIVHIASDGYIPIDLNYLTGNIKKLIIEPALIDTLNVVYDIVSLRITTQPDILFPPAVTCLLDINELSIFNLANTGFITELAVKTYSTGPVRTRIRIYS